MSININVVANKPEFNNFFSEQIVLPVNCEASMAKANIDIPVLQMVGITVPDIVLALRSEICLEVSIDGIRESITWRNIYDAHTTFAAHDVDAGISEDDYFGGFYEYIPNNAIYVENPAGADFFKIQFASVLAKAINEKYEFYEVSVDLDLVASDADNVRLISPQRPLVCPNFTSTSGYVEAVNLKGFSLIATYNPQKKVQENETATAFTAANVNNWVLSAGDNTITALNNISAATAWYNNVAHVSPNGGYVSTTINHGSQKMAFGVNLVGVAHATNNFTPQIATYDTTLIDVGFEFSENANGDKVFNIIDGQTEYVYYDTTNNSEVVADRSKFYPNEPILQFDNGDVFFIQIQRGNLYNGTTEFVIRLYQADAGDDIISANTKLIYVANRTLNSPSIRPNVGFLSEVSLLANSFSNNGYLPRTDQDNKMADWHLDTAPALGLDPPTAQSIGSIELEIKMVAELTNLDERLFWSAMVGYSNNVIGNTNQVIKRVLSSIESEGQIVKAHYKTSYTTQNSLKRIFLGECNASDVYLTFQNGLTINDRSIKSLRNIPKELKVSINNMPIKSYQGKYNVVGDSNQFSTTSGGEQRIIGTIPLPVVLDTDTNIPITYEPFNMTFKPMNNPEPFMVNQLLVEIFFQDYDTNQRKKFDSVNGFLSLDLNFRQGAKPPPIMNNIRAI